MRTGTRESNESSDWGFGHFPSPGFTIGPVSRSVVSLVLVPSLIFPGSRLSSEVCDRGHHHSNNGGVNRRTQTTDFTDRKGWSRGGPWFLMFLIEPQIHRSQFLVIEGRSPTWESPFYLV